MKAYYQWLQQTANLASSLAERSAHQPTSSMPRTFLSLLATLLLGSPLLAHQVEQHFLTITLQPDGLTGRLEMDAGYALPELRSAEDETVPTGAWLAALPESTLDRIRSEGRIYLLRVLQLQLDDHELPLEITFGNWGTDWPMYFDERPDTFARMVWDIHVDYGQMNGTLELFWNEAEEGPSLALQTRSGERELPLITVSQGEEHTLAFVNHSAEANSREEGVEEQKRKTPRWQIAALLLVSVLAVAFYFQRRKS